MADFEIAYRITKKFEGGYTADPDDNGNWTGGKKGVGICAGTNWGITAGLYAGFIKRTPTAADMKDMPEETAKKIYRANYWNPIRGDEIIDQEAANKLYDAGVNMGVGTAIILAKRGLAINENTHMDDHFLNQLNNVS